MSHLLFLIHMLDECCKPNDLSMLATIAMRSLKLIEILQGANLDIS